MTDGFRNLTELHRIQSERLGPATALRYKRHGIYHDLSWRDYRACALAGAAALVDAGVEFGDRVGLLSENRIEWLIADMAILAAGAVNVPPHAPLTAAQVRFQLEDAGVSWLLVSGGEQLDKVRELGRSLPQLRGVVVFDSAAVGRIGDPSYKVFTWRGFLQRGREALARLESVMRVLEEGQDPDTLATIMYTSGTTGNPKGVMLTHGNLLSNAMAMMHSAPPRPGDVLLSWLPYSHIYARTIDHYVRICAGSPIALAESADTVVENLKEIEPTHFTAVPRFYEKVLTAVTSPDVVVSMDVEVRSHRLRNIFGPRIDYLTCGGAPLPLSVAKAYRAAGMLLLQGYGLTECAPVISFNCKKKYKLDTVGGVLEGVEVRIAADGEILTRGPHVMPGYWKNPDATAEAIRDGWLHTGDLGAIDADGFLKITGRKKELLVLSSGQKVPPNQLEGLILADPCIDQVMICGEGRSYLTALVVPHWDNLREELSDAGIASLPNGDLARSAATAEFLHYRIDRALAGLSRYERVRKLHILENPFTVANGELTVSLKLRRAIVAEKYAAVIDRMYDETPCR
jgi:long-chain acyl-CoA synthetase